jgi:DNA glycosylase AlkZ-like
MGKVLDASSILAERLRRQRLTEPVEDVGGYLDAFRALQPVSPVFFSYPGEPPRLSARTRFDDAPVAGDLRAERAIVKGRFLGGTIGYVLADDLPVYANTFLKPLPRLDAIQETVLEAVRNAGPLAPRQIKEETGLLNKQIMPALHRLQKAFMVYEDQIDTDWDRGWYDFGAEWPDVAVTDDEFAASAQKVLLRFLKSHVFASFEQVKDWSQLPSKALTGALQDMKASGLVVPCEVEELGEGWVCEEDTGLAPTDVPPSVFMLHKSDPLVRSHASELKRRFGREEILQYLLIDGAFHGAVLGHWRIGPHDVDDIALTLPDAACKDRRDAILAEVATQYHPPRSRIVKYTGQRL